MSLNDTIQSLNNHIKEAYSELQNHGYYLPDQKNAANLAATVRREFRPPIDPDNATLAMLQAALLYDNPEDYLPIGTSIADTYAGNSNPLIITQYLNSSNNATYGGAVGAIVTRQFVEPISQVFGSSNDYTTSSLKSFLDTTYYNNCSDDLKEAVSEINIPVGSTTVAAKAFAMSGIEVGGTYNSGEGIFWDYWKQKTGWTSANNGSNNGRVMKDRDGTARAVWLRSRGGSSGVCSVGTGGNVSNSGAPGSSRGVLPAFFVAKPQ